MSKSIVAELKSLFYPRICVTCGEELLDEEEAICITCMHNLPRTGNHLVPGNSLESLMSARIPFERIASYCAYSKGGMLQPLIYKLKYYGRKDIGVLLGRLFGTDLLESDFLESVDLIVPVPLHPDKEKSRGYNQAEMISNGLSQVTFIPVSTGNLIRVISNPTQTRRSKTERWDNVEGIFSVSDPALFNGKHLLLVDDIITTGSTIEACGVALKACSSIHISIVALGQAV